MFFHSVEEAEEANAYKLFFNLNFNSHLQNLQYIYQFQGLNIK
jgi:hypothetical protein